MLCVNFYFVLHVSILIYIDSFTEKPIEPVNNGEDCTHVFDNIKKADSYETGEPSHFMMLVIDDSLILQLIEIKHVKIKTKQYYFEIKTS